MEQSTMKDKYAGSWEKYKRFGRYELFAVVGIILISILLFPIVFVLKLSWPVENLAFVLLFVAGYFHYCRYIWPCPRCGKRFNGSLGIGGIRDECQYCALSKWATDDDDDAS